jgi:putative nucleotidyltransferase with HDIG domain
VEKIFKKVLQLLKSRVSRKKSNGNKNLLLHQHFWTISVTLMVVFLISLMLPRGKSYKYGDLKEKEVYVGDEIIAPFTFAINKTEEELKRDRQRAENEVLSVFTRNDTLCDRHLVLLSAFFDSLKMIREKSSNTNFLIKEVSRLLQKNNIEYSDENLLQFLKSSNNEAIKTFNEQLSRVGRDICSVGILNVKKQNIKKVDNKISVITINEEFIEELQSFYDIDEVEGVLLEKLRSTFSNDDLRVRMGYLILKAFLKPNITYDAEETNRRVVEARNNVPLAKGTVLEKERIIDRNERITKDHIDKLNSLAVELAEREASESVLLTFVRYLGKFLMISMAVVILIIFLALSKSRVAILKDVKRVVLIAAIFVLVSFLAYNINHFGLNPYLIPITIGSMLLTIFFDTKIGFIGTIILSIIIGFLRGNEFNISVVSIFAGTIAVLSVSRIRTRSWLFNSILMIIGAYLVSITIMEILRYTPFTTIAKYWGYGAINGFISPLLVYGLQVIFEYIFDIATDMRLLELSDLNNPLLRKLSIEAPGTYHHSLMVGNLAEAAADSIGANALLARVGAYYHDIGKIEKREYFIENQMRSKNPHEKLSPTMSCLILMNHVKKGLELARKYKLPKQIRDFIAEHHGTNLIAFFYQKALEKSDNEEINESSFRYPGPKPKTKETGIVMLADAIEAAARTLKDPSPSRIRGMVISIVQDRFRESELDDCPLTLRELTRIIESFETVLLGTFHSRIEYPDQDEKLLPIKEKRIKEKNVELHDQY